MKNVLYGAGFYAQSICEELEKNKIFIDFIIDEYKDEKEMFGKKIKRLNEVDLKDYNIYITTGQIQIANELKNLTNKNIFSVHEILLKYPSLFEKCLLKQNLWYSKNKSEMLDYKKISLLKNLLKDTKSLELLDRVVNFRETLNPKYYLEPSNEKQYFPSDIYLFEKHNYIKFVDGGTYIGDDLESYLLEFKKLNIKIDSLVCFEPDTTNIEKLTNQILELKENYNETDFIVYPCALYSSNSILEFSNSKSSNSSLFKDTSKNKIQAMTVSLDKTLIGFEPNYIKLDIEGSEREAIIGMKEIIKTKSPTLAICLYHKPHDLWDLPLLINEINPNYNMHIRIYGHLGTELVLYCVPR